MVHRVLVMGLVLAAVSSPVLACELESWGAAAYVSQYDYSGLAEQERLAAERRALQEFHDKKMAEAKAAFISRFKIKVDDSEAASAESVSNADADAAAEAEPEAESAP